MNEERTNDLAERIAKLRRNVPSWRRSHDTNEAIAIIEELEAENEKLKAQILRTIGMTEADLADASIDSGKTISEVFGNE